MVTSRLPLDIKDLLTTSIDSVGQLEVLLTFFNQPNREWTPSAMSLEIRSHETIIRQQMEKLAASGFLKADSQERYTYAPTAELIPRVENLNKVYREMSVAVIAFIYEKPTDKLKGFADAFKIKKD